MTQERKHSLLYAHQHFVSDKEKFRIEKDGSRHGETPNILMDAGNPEMADFIVRACNSHYKLVEALRDYVHAAFEHGNKGLKDSVDPDGDLLHAMKQVLAEAEAA